MLGINIILTIYSKWSTCTSCALMTLLNQYGTQQVHGRLGTKLKSLYNLQPSLITITLVTINGASNALLALHKL